MNNERNERTIVIVGDKIPAPANAQIGPGILKQGNDLIALHTGLLQDGRGRVSIIPFQGTYEPKAGDVVIGVVEEANPGNWILDIRAPYKAPMHVSECPWRVEFGETISYLRPGDAVICKVLFLDEQRKVQVTLKDRALGKLDEGEIFEINPVKVARVIGRSGSMLELLKEYIECWMYVGQNGRVWVAGEAQEIVQAKKIIQFICDEAHKQGLTERVKAELEAYRPGGVNRGWSRVLEEE